MKSPHDEGRKEGRTRSLCVPLCDDGLFPNPIRLGPSIRGLAKLSVVYRVSQVRRLHSTLWVAII
jgi:hypothetical protein